MTIFAIFDPFSFIFLYENKGKRGSKMAKNGHFSSFFMIKNVVNMIKLELKRV